MNPDERSPLPVVFDTVELIQPDRPRIHAGCGTLVMFSETNDGSRVLVCPCCLVQIREGRELVPLPSVFRPDPTQGARFEAVPV